MAVQFIAFIGEEGENMCEFAALSTDTLPTTHQGKPLTPGSVASVYDAAGAAATTSPTIKRYLELVPGSPAWRPMV